MLSYKKCCFALALCCSVLLAMMACSSESDVAGGVSEETNTLAGILVDQNGKPAAGIAVMARFVQVDSIVEEDTTGKDGSFAFEVSHRGLYGISAMADSLAFFQLVDFQGKDMDVSGKLMKAFDFAGQVGSRENMPAEGIAVGISGSNWKTNVTEDGSFKLKSVPEGSFVLKVTSPDKVHFADGFYMVHVSAKENSVFGPIPADKVTGPSPVGNSLLGVAKDVAQFMLPMSPEYELKSWWPLDNLEEKGSLLIAADARSWTEGVEFYGKPSLVDGMDEKAVALLGPDQFGVVESDNHMLDDATAFTLEAWVRVDSATGDAKSYRKNIVGKLGFGEEGDKDVFSLALVNGDCGAAKPSVGFFVASGEGDSLSCENGVVTEDFAMKAWTYVVASWNNGKLDLYLNGELSGSKTVGIQKMGKSPESIFFGKESLNVKLDDVRISTTAVNAADVLYRYYLKGGAK